MLSGVSSSDAGGDGHVGYLAGRYRDGAYSDMWTDVRRCAHATFIGYAPACSCGWRAPAQPVSDIAPLLCHRIWFREHIAGLATSASVAPEPPIVAVATS
jgi:hypothetical protein